MSRTSKQGAANKPLTKIPARLLEDDSFPEVKSFKAYEPPPGVVPNNENGKAALAMDATPYDYVNQAFMMNSDVAVFIGYPALASLAQTTEYFNQATVLSDEMVRNWISVKSTDDENDRADEIEKLLVKYDVKRLIRKAIMQDSLFGVCHIFIDNGGDIEIPLILDSRAIPKGTKIKFKTIDPTWCYPAMYNARDPLADDFYKPQSWFVMGQQVHESRIIDIVSRPVPDILKPSYNFGGLSLTQMMLPYVQDWHDAKSNVIKILRTLRMRGLKTDMEARLQDPGEFDKRIKLFNKYQDNFGIWALDTEEELVHHQTSLGELSSLLSNYQEQLCIPARTTNLKLLGTPPAGLSASGDAEIETWHETVSGYQEHYRHAIETIIKIIQLAEFGDIDETIYFDFMPLDEVGEKERAEINEIAVRTIATASDSQIISTEQAAETLRNLDMGGFEHINIEEIPEEDIDTLPTEPKGWGSVDA